MRERDGVVLSGGEVDVEPLEVAAGPFLRVTEVNYPEVSRRDEI